MAHKLNDPSLTKQHFKAPIFRGLYLYIEHTYPAINVSDLFLSCGLSKEFIFNDGNWVSIHFQYELNKKIQKLIMDPDFWKKSGEFGTQKEVIGRPFHAILKSAMTLQAIYQTLPRLTQLINKVIRVKAQKMNATTFSLEFSTFEANLSEEEKLKLRETFVTIVESAQGYYQSFPRIQGLPIAESNLEIDLSGENPKACLTIKIPYGYKRLLALSGNRLLAALPILGLSILSIYQPAEVQSPYLITACAAYYIFLFYRKYRQLKIELNDSQATIESSDIKYSQLQDTKEKLQRRLEQEELINSVTRDVLDCSEPKELISRFCTAIVKTLGFDRVLFLAYNAENNLLSYHSSFTSKGVEIDSRVANFSLPLIENQNSETRNISWVLSSNQPILISNPKVFLLQVSDPLSRSVLENSGSIAFCMLPVRTPQNPHGVLIVDSIGKEMPLDEQSLQLLDTLCKQIAISLDKLLAQKNAIKAFEEADRQKDMFLANTTHELKTPIHGILGITESIIDGTCGEISPRGLKNLSIVVDSARRLGKLVEEILDQSKVKNENFSIELQPTEINHILTDAVALLRPLAKEKNLTLEIEPTSFSYSAIANKDRVHQILINVISNAIKFTQKGSIKVQLSGTKEEVNISVIDSGIGISQDFMKKIFQPFQQEDRNERNSRGGVGLGLGICKNLVEKMNGKINIKSKINEGTEVLLTFPLMEKKLQETLPIEELNLASATPPSPNPVIIVPDKSTEALLAKTSHSYDRILVVDDEPVNLQILDNHLSNLNFEIRLATSGESAFQHLEDNWKPDIVLLDIMMPTMNGFEVCERIRKKHSSSEMPIIFLTAKREEKDIVRGLSSGANDYLTKPFSKAELLARIKVHLATTKIANAYSRFVPWAALERLKYDSILDVVPGTGVQKTLTVMFSDIRNFTGMSEQQNPEETFKFVNRYLEQVTPGIYQSGGIIDKFIGDCIMATFDEPISAIRAGIQMIRDLRKFNVSRQLHGLPPIKAGVGINSGTVVFGLVGIDKRLEFTVIADAVNVASRLDSMTRHFGSSMVVNKVLLNQISLPEDLDFRDLGTLKLKGREEEIGIVEIFEKQIDLAHFSDLPLELQNDFVRTNETLKSKIASKDRFEQGLQAKKDGHLMEAYEIFLELEKKWPGDDAVKYYLQSIVDQIQVEGVIAKKIA